MECNTNRDAAVLARVEHDEMVDELVLLHATIHVSSSDDRANGEFAAGHERPGLVHVKSRHVDTPAWPNM
jgi:hypothetical protein